MAGRTRRRWVHRLVWSGSALVVVLLLVVGAVAGYALHLNGEIGRVRVGDLTSKAAGGAERGTENILLVGSTSRCALKVQNPAYGTCAEGVTGVNSDVVMILHLNAGTHSLSILSIPRDTFVPNARAEGANKIDAALAQGPTQLVDAIQDDVGIPIQHYVELNFDTFANVVNALGGIHMYFPEPVFDAYSGLRILTGGCLPLNGTQALQVVRARHLQYKGPGVSTNDPNQWPQEVQSDLARIRRDHEFLRVLATQVAHRGLGNPLTDEQLAAAVAPQLEVDSGMSSTALANLVLTNHGVNINGAPQLTTPVLSTTFGSYHYKGGNYGDIVWPSEPQDSTVVDQFLGIGANDNSLTGQPLPTSGQVPLAVLNGTGVANAAGNTASALRTLGYPIISVGDTATVGAESETRVYYADAAHLGAAERARSSLRGVVVLARDPSMVTVGAAVTVVTGSSFTIAALPPAASTPPGPTGAARSATSSTAPAQVGAGAQTPSPPVEALAPWDPRSCNATGGPGP